MPVDAERELHVQILAVLQLHPLSRVGGQVAGDDVVAVVGDGEVQVREQVHVGRVVHVVVVDGGNDLGLPHEPFHGQTVDEELRLDVRFAFGFVFGFGFVFVFVLLGVRTFFVLLRGLGFRSGRGLGFVLLVFVLLFAFVGRR